MSQGRQADSPGAGLRLGKASRSVPALDAARAIYGAGLLLLPSRGLAALARSPLDPATVGVARVLGVRQLLQSAVLVARCAPRWQLGGVAVDAAHAASMLVVARWSRRSLHRRLAARNARTAGMFSIAGAVAAARGFRDARPGHQ